MDSIVADANNMAGPSKKICPYCGVRITTTDDHVVPKALFDEQPTNHLTVRCCEPCNSEKSPLDAIFRDYLVLDWVASEHPIAKHLFSDKAGRAISRRQSKVANSFVKEGRLGPVFDAAGLWMGDYWKAPIENREIERELEYIAKGLTHKRFGRVLDSSYSLEVTRIHQLKTGEALKFAKDHSTHAPIILRGKRGIVCLGLWMHVDEEPTSGSWVLVFYESVVFKVDVVSQTAALMLDQHRNQKNINGGG